MAAARAAARASSSWGPAVAVIAPAAVPVVVGPPAVVLPVNAADAAPAGDDAAPAGDDA